MNEGELVEPHSSFHRTRLIPLSPTQDALVKDLMQRENQAEPPYLPPQDALVKDLMQRENQAQLFTNLANSRISELNQELVGSWQGVVGGTKSA